MGKSGNLAIMMPFITTHQPRQFAFRAFGFTDADRTSLTTGAQAASLSSERQRSISQEHRPSRLAADVGGYDHEPARHHARCQLTDTLVKSAPMVVYAPLLMAARNAWPRGKDFTTVRPIRELRWRSRFCRPFTVVRPPT